MNSKTVLITGGATGIGLATAQWFAARSARLAIAYLEEAHAERAKHALTGAEVLWLRADLRSASDIADMVNRAAETFSSIDVLVNCASRTGVS
ncbi:MAG: SDR family NAD(P)-dependent oxidoreductase, partial [Bryobacterales bacterium]|nr:SDR family NAD(P)-dependent oxidoreductase [Bryobacterales bacterium]